MAELFTNTIDKSLPFDRFLIQHIGERYYVSGMQIVTVPKEYKNDSAKIVICALPDNQDYGAVFFVDKDYQVAGSVEFDGQSYTVLASGSCKLKVEDEVEDDKLCSISSLELDLKSNTSNLLCLNDKIVKITGTKDADTIYIARTTANGVNPEAILDFSQGGTDTIYFYGATTVQKISGGVAYSSA